MDNLAYTYEHKLEEQVSCEIIELYKHDKTELKFRFLANLIDNSILIIPSLLLAAGFSILIFSIFPSKLASGSNFIQAVCVGGGVSSFFLLHWLYFSIGHSSKYKSTFGMSVLGMKIQTKEGRSLSFIEASNRYWLWFFGSLMLGINFIGLFIKNKNMFHDEIIQSEIIQDL